MDMVFSHGGFPEHKEYPPQDVEISAWWRRRRQEWTTWRVILSVFALRTPCGVVSATCA